MNDNPLLPMHARFPTPQAAVYQHYKGPLYQAFFVAHDANYEDRAVVVYMGLQLDGVHQGPRIAVRTLGRTERYPDHDAWWDRLHIGDGHVVHPHRDVEALVDSFPRFNYRADHYVLGLEQR